VLFRGKIEDFHVEGLPPLHHVVPSVAAASRRSRLEHRKPPCPQARDHEPASTTLFARHRTSLGYKETPAKKSVGQELASARRLHRDSNDEEHHARIPDSGGCLPTVRNSHAFRSVGTLIRAASSTPTLLCSCTTCGAWRRVLAGGPIEHSTTSSTSRYQYMESEFPSELAARFKTLRTIESVGVRLPGPSHGVARSLSTWPGVSAGRSTPSGLRVLFGLVLAACVPGLVGGTQGAGASCSFFLWGLLRKKTTNARPPTARHRGRKSLCSARAIPFTATRPSVPNDFLFLQQLAVKNFQTLNYLFEGLERVWTARSSSPPHCFQTLCRSTPHIGGNFN